MTVTLNSDRLGARTFSFGVVRDATFTPLLAYLAVANVLTAYERATGPASITVKGTASIRSHGALSFEDVFTGDQPIGMADAYVAGPLTQLFRNTSEPVDVERMHTIHYFENYSLIQKFFLKFDKRVRKYQLYDEMLSYLDDTVRVLSVGGDNYSLDYGIPPMFTDLDNLVQEKKNRSSSGVLQLVLLINYQNMNDL